MLWNVRDYASKSDENAVLWDDGTGWNIILKPIADITGATLITYGRSGFGKSELNTMKAIEVFRLNVILYPASTYAYESLAEAYEAAGNKALAIKNYERSLQLSPGNTSAEVHLKKLLPTPSIK